MGNWDTSEGNTEAGKVTSTGLTLAQFKAFHDECKAQPAWRSDADKIADYFDGNQLDSEIIRKQQSIGMPPAIEPLMGPELDKLCGIESRLRKNWRVIPNSDVSDDQIAEALNVKLNAAERHSKADKACSLAFKNQAGLGVHFLEVGRETDPFKFPHRVTEVGRNECFWDWKGTRDPDMHDHRYFIRRRWTDKQQAKTFFPDQAELIEHASTGWTNFDKFSTDGGQSTGLYTGGGVVQWSGVGSPTMLQGDVPGTYALLSSAYATERTRGESIEEQEWRDLETNRVCIFECWYRVWEQATVFSLPNGRTVEYDPENDMHIAALASGMVQVTKSVISKVRVSMWLGPHRLSDAPCPFKHNRFPYVPFWNKREDRTGVPFGLGRGWIYLQDCVNAVGSKLRWGISAITTIRTDGAYAGTDEQFHHEVGRLDADIVLDAKHMALPGARFESKRDFQLTDEQNKLMQDSRDAIKRTGGGLDTETPEGQIEHIPHQHGALFDNFRDSRNEVGELLLAMIIEDMEGREEEVTIKGDVTEEDKTVVINQKVVDESGRTYLNNDITQVLLKVELEDVPSTPSYRSQQMQSFSEVVKSAPDALQPVMYPFMLSLLDVPNRDKVVAAIRDASKLPTQAQIQQQIDDAVSAALVKANVQFKTDELALKGKLQEAQIAKMAADTTLTRVTSMYEAMQAGGVVVSAPGVAPVGDVILQSAGYDSSNPRSANPGIENIPIPTNVQPENVDTHPPLALHQNTHPGFPPHPMSPGIGEQRGIEGGQH